MFCLVRLPFVPNQYNKNTMGKKTAKDSELKSISIFFF
jgi:hypothetical protein